LSPGMVIVYTSLLVISKFWKPLKGVVVKKPFWSITLTMAPVIIITTKLAITRKLLAGGKGIPSPMKMVHKSLIKPY